MKKLIAISLLFCLTLPRVATLLRVLATRKGNTDEDDSGLARALGYVDYGKYL